MLLLQGYVKQFGLQSTSRCAKQIGMFANARKLISDCWRADTQKTFADIGDIGYIQTLARRA